MLEFQPIREARSNEEIFFEFYSRLLQWATQLTHNEREEAEDLVHDLYIHFTRIQSVLDHVDRLDSYLFSMLRNLNYTRLRRVVRNPIKDLSLVEFESLERGLAAVDRRGLFFARADLKKICEYACERKNTSRSASLLILRFFFGYYPTELMKVAQMKRSAVDKALQVARKEARSFAERPNSIRSIASIAPPDRAPMAAVPLPDDTYALFDQLRLAIFSTCESACFGRAALTERYHQVPPPGFSMAELAHLASCRVCLDHANRILGLPLLAERSPFDTLDRDTPSDPGNFNGANQTAPSPKKPGKRTKPFGDKRNLERKAREVYEHRPQNLQVAVNGDIRTSQTVTAEISELHLKLHRREVPGFLEVLSEQGICLAYLQVRDPLQEASLSQTERIQLSDGRTLELSLSFAGIEPLVHVVYHDPVMAEDTGTQPETLSMASFSKPTPADASNQAVPGRKPLLVGWLRDVLARLRERLFDGPAGYAVIFGLIATLAITLFVLYDTPSAIDLLHRATVAETAVHPGEALHQQIEISELSGDNAVITTQRVDLWEEVGTEPGAGNLTRRLYDNGGKLKEQELTNSKNGTILYHKDGEIHSTAIRLDNATANDVWRLTPSASEMQNAGAELTTRNIVTQGSVYMVDERSSQPNGLTEATLVLRKSDLHPTEETVTFRESGRVRRFRIVEAAYEYVPMREVKPGVFAPDRELLPPVARRRARSTLLNTHPLLQATPDLEIHVLYLLSQIGADLGGETQLHRSPSGPLVVSGIVDSAQRKAQLLLQLSLIRESAKSVRVEIAVAGQTGLSGSKRQPESLKVIDPAADVVPADGILRAMFRRQGVPISKMDDAVQTFCQRATQSSSDAREQAWALTTALHLLSPEEVRDLSPEGKQDWVAVVTRHALALNAALTALGNQIAPLRDASVKTAATTASETSSVEDVTTSVTQILALVNAQDAVLRSALTLSTEVPAANPPQQFQPPDFWHAMDRLLALSASVARTSQTLDAAMHSPNVN